MKTKRERPSFTVTRKAELSAKGGHPWIYCDEVTSVEGEYENGGLADVFSQKGSYLGTAFISENSKIRLRIISVNANETFTREFWERRVKYAIDYRITVMGERDFSCCRLIFGEADGFPGLTVDRFNDLLVAQVLSVGTEKLKATLFRIIVERLAELGVTVRGIYERNDVAIRSLEGLEQGKGWSDAVPHSGEPVTEIIENGIRYRVDVENGQKTGFFLDQKYNRLAIAKIAKGKTVLDCFTHTGSFALNAVMGGAERVTAVDISETAIESVRLNAKLNGLSDKIECLTCDVFDLLPRLAAEKHADYDLIILDPPAFTKSRKTISSAERGYKEINYRAMRLLPRGGYLATASCSHFMDERLFLSMLSEAASDAGVTLKLVEARKQAPDHPILLNVNETDYLKFYIFQIV